MLEKSQTGTRVPKKPAIWKQAERGREEAEKGMMGREWDWMTEMMVW